MLTSYKTITRSSGQHVEYEIVVVVDDEPAVQYPLPRGSSSAGPDGGRPESRADYRMSMYMTNNGSSDSLTFVPAGATLSSGGTNINNNNNNGSSNNNSNSGSSTNLINSSSSSSSTRADRAESLRPIDRLDSVRPIEKNESSRSHKASWIVQRRFSEFYSLQRILKSFYNGEWKGCAQSCLSV
jgi:hypothetical protein